MLGILRRRSIAQPPALSEADKIDRTERLELYKLAVEMADRVSQRRQTANSFYLSINTLLISGSTFIGSAAGATKTAIFMSLAGILVCAYWIMAIESYKTLNQAKFAFINSIEENLVIKPFSTEWLHLDPDGDGRRHKPFHKTEKVVPKIFLGLYVLVLASLVAWTRVLSALIPCL